MKDIRNIGLSFLLMTDVESLYTNTDHKGIRGSKIIAINYNQNTQILYNFLNFSTFCN